MYGVIVCPRCKRAKGVDLEQKTTTCVCGFEIVVLPVRIRARAKSGREIAPLVGKVNAEIAGGLEAYQRDAAPARRRRSRDVHLRVAAIALKAHDRVGRIRAAAIELTRELEVFSLADWTRVLEELGVPRAEEALASLVRVNFVLEPKEGFYRTVSLSP